MEQELHNTISDIIDHAQSLLNEDDGPLDEKQKGYVRIIIANSEKFIHLATLFLSVPLAQVSREMRHDLGNPLTPIHGYSELLRMRMFDTLNDQQQYHVNMIHAHTNRVRMLVDDLVQAAREASAGEELNS